MGKNNDHFLYRQTISSRLCYFTEEYLVFHAQPNERFYGIHTVLWYSVQYAIRNFIRMVNC